MELGLGQGHISSHQRPVPIGPGRELLWRRVSLRLGLLNCPKPRRVRL